MEVEIGNNLKAILELLSERGYGTQVTTDGHNIRIALSAPIIDAKVLNAVGAKSITEFFAGSRKRNFDDLELKAILTKYLNGNTFDGLLVIIANLASEQGQHFTFYQAK